MTFETTGTVGIVDNQGGEEASNEMSNKMDCVVIPDDFPGYDKRHFCIASHYQQGLGNVLIPYGMVQDRIAKLARDIFTDFLSKGRTVVTVICVLRGGSRFFNDLLEQFDRLNTGTPPGGHTLDITVEFIRVKSYDGDKSSGEVRLQGEETWQQFCSGKNVLLVEDVIDTGLTMKKLLEVLEGHGTKSLTVTALCKKRRSDCSYVPDYCGFEVPDRYIVGYNYDFNNHFREMAHVCFLGEKAKDIYPAEKY